MVKDESIGGLSGSLLNVVADSSRVAALYEALGEYCHLVRNRLNSVKLSLYLAARPGSGQRDDRLLDLERRYLMLERFVEQLQTICRPMRLTPMPVAVGMLVEDRRPAWTEWLGARGIELELVPPRGPAVGVFDPLRLGQGLDALASWRGEVAPADSSVRVEWWSMPDALAVDWSEPRATSLGEPSPDGDAGTPASLALPLLAKAVAAHGGTVDVSLADGFRVALRWPHQAPSG
jgi:hypothetical protein